jgi:hypothetical protein
VSGRGRHAGAGATRRCRRGCAWSAGAAVARRQLVRTPRCRGARRESSPADLGQSRPLAAAAAPLLNSRATPRLRLSHVIRQSRSTRPSVCSPGMTELSESGAKAQSGSGSPSTRLMRGRVAGITRRRRRAAARPRSSSLDTTIQTCGDDRSGTEAATWRQLRRAPTRVLLPFQTTRDDRPQRGCWSQPERE